MDNISYTLRTVARKYPDKDGVIEAKTGRKLSFAELENLSDNYADYFSKNGVRPGDRVMLMVKPSADFVSLTFALFKLGATIILIDPGMGYRNLLKCIRSVHPDVLVGIPKACLFKALFRSTFQSIRKTFCCGFSFGIFGRDISKEVLSKPASTIYPIYKPKKQDLAAIIFTTGSTGPPKGVQYEHAIFSVQLKHIRDYYQITPDDIDQPAFPLFALFSTALGACAVIPDMDPTRPAQVDPKRFVESIEKYKVSYSFGSPAIWNVVSRYCIDNDIRLKSLKKVLMAGAPVPGELISRVFQSISQQAEIHTPYGATESLPVASMMGNEIVNETWSLTQKGYGSCVGRALPGISIQIIKPSDKPVKDINQANFLAPGEKGEIIVKGNIVTRVYDNNPKETTLAKIADGEQFWHRMGDIGYLDTKGRLWFCGRKAHKVETEKETKYTICCEAIANNHPEVYRTALVGVEIPQRKTHKTPVLLIEKTKDCRKSDAQLIDEVKALCRESLLTRDIEHFFIHPAFPVDIRHNAKIFREKLAIWAEKKQYE